MRKFLIAAAALAIFTNTTYADENKVCFNYPISSYDFVSGSVSEDQILNPEIDIEGNCLIIEAGKTLSSTPVNWVKNEMQDSGYNWTKENMTYTGSNKNQTPDKLYFAVKLNLYINIEANNTSYGIYECKNIYIGPGSNGQESNIWWFFANNNSQKHNISCYPVGYNKFIDSVTVLKGSNDYSFKLAF